MADSILMSEIDFLYEAIKSIGITLTAQLVFTLAGLSLSAATFSWAVLSSVFDRLRKLESNVEGVINVPGGVNAVQQYRNSGITIFARIHTYHERRGAGSDTPDYVRLMRQIQDLHFATEANRVPLRFVVAFFVFVGVAISSMLFFDVKETGEQDLNFYAIIDGLGLGSVFFAGLGILIDGARNLVITIREMGSGLFT